MRWVTYVPDRVGLLEGGLIHGLPPGTRLVDLLGDLPRAGRHALDRPYEVVPLAEATLMAPIPDPPSIRDCLCFLDHKRNTDRAGGLTGGLPDVWYEIPAFYFAAPSAIGPYDDVPIAPGSAWFDFELEIAAILGEGGRDLSPEEADKRIAGYTIFCDWSARDLQLLEGQLAIGQAKGKDSANTLGPWLVTPDELDGLRRDGKLALRVEARVNGRLIGGGRTDDMDWSFGEVISYASRGVDLRPGDVFGSGTVPGCCLIEHLDFYGDPAAFPGWLQDGDVVTLTAEGLGEVRQIVRASAPAIQIAPRPGRRPEPERVNPAKSVLPYTRGLHQVADGVWAWLLPDGGYGLSNAGLIAGDGGSLLVDTLYDLPLTAEMLSAMRAATDRHPLTHAVFTHSNGDHTHGGSLLDDSVQIIAAEGTAHEMRTEIPPDLTTAFQVADLGPVLTPYLRPRFRGFDFAGARLRHPDRLFDRRLVLDVGGREVHVLNLGPAHTEADAVVHVPDAGVLFAGDLLFTGCTPIVWKGPISNWIAACDTMIGLDPAVVVPGHGPVTDVEGIRDVRGYLRHVIEQADAAHAAGLGFKEAAFGIDLGEYGQWLDAERVVVNLYRRYQELDPDLPEVDRIPLFAVMAEWHATRMG